MGCIKAKENLNFQPALFLKVNSTTENLLIKVIGKVAVVVVVKE